MVPEGYPVPTINTIPKEGTTQNGKASPRIIATTVIMKKLSPRRKRVPGKGGWVGGWVDDWVDDWVGV